MEGAGAARLRGCMVMLINPRIYKSLVMPNPGFDVCTAANDYFLFVFFILGLDELN